MKMLFSNLILTFGVYTEGAVKKKASFTFRFGAQGFFSRTAGINKTYHDRSII